MNVLFYALPCFLGHGEAFRYCISHLNLLMNYNKTSNINTLIVKEKNLPINIFKNYINIIPNEKSLDFSLDSIDPFKNLIKNNCIDIHHCFHNGFSLRKCYNVKSISTIYTTLPLTGIGCLDDSYSKLYINRLQNTIACSNSIIVPYNFMKNDLCRFFSIKGENIHVIPPSISFDLIGKSKPLSKAYVKSKFNISKDYYLYIGEINPRNTLIDTIKLFKYYSCNNDVNLVLSLNFLAKNKNLYFELISLVDRLGLTSKIIFIDTLSIDDFINLINASICFLNLNQFNELNVTSVYALFLNTPILTYQTHSNLEFLENYPVYISNYVDAYNVNFQETYSMDNDELYYIIQRFNFNTVLESLCELYSSVIGNEEMI